MQNINLLSQYQGIENALGRKDWDEVVFLAHQLKGASKSLGVTDIARVLKNIESAGLRNSVEDVRQYLDVLGTTIRACVN